MKKLLAVLLALSMLVCFTACGDEEDYELTMENWDYSGAVGVGVPDEVMKAFESVEKPDDVSYTPIAYLGSQVVAGTNYALLCKGVSSASDSEVSMYIVIVFSGLQGETEIISAEKFDFVDVSGKSTGAQTAGGWEISDKKDNLPSEITADFYAKTVEYTKCSLNPLAYMGSLEKDATYTAYVARGEREGDLNKLEGVILRKTSTGLELKSVSSFEIGDYNK